MRISGCVIVRNEQENIANCINNLKSITDEIIVVDTGSEDNTIQIAEELGAFVYKHKWENDFSKAKNAALEHANGNWIVFLDADEYFNEDSLTRIRTIIHNVHSSRNVEALTCEIRNVDTDTGKTISINNVLRIFRNSKKTRYINKIHEEIRNNGKPLKCLNIKNKATIIHTGYTSSLKRMKAERNLELLLNNPEDEKSAYYLATTYYILNDYSEAYKYADLALGIEAITKFDYLAYKMHLIKIRVTMATDGSNSEKIQNLINEATKKYGTHPEIVAAEALFLKREKRYSKALEYYAKAFDCQEKYGSTFTQNDFPGTIEESYYNIAQILYLMNREADALSYYVQALRLNKFNSSAFGSMLSLCGSIPENEAISFINSIYDINDEEEVKFIMSHVADCGRSKIVLYYANKWNNTFGHEDDALIYAFISQGNYKNAQEIALLYLENARDVYIPLVTSVLLMGRLFSEAKKIRDAIGNEYFDIVACCAEKRKYSGDSKAYIAVLTILEKYMNQYDITDYLRTGSELGISATWEIAEVFLNGIRLEAAATHFDKLFELENDRETKAWAAFKSGYCFYKLKRYRESLGRFEKAAQDGYTENDLVEFLCWIADQAPEAEIQGKVRDIQKML